MMPQWCYSRATIASIYSPGAMASFGPLGPDDGDVERVRGKKAGRNNTTTIDTDLPLFCVLLDQRKSEASIRARFVR